MRLQIANNQNNSQNIKNIINSNYLDKQETAREFDTNGWYEIKNNPISRVGVFPYSGRTVGGNPNKIYNVYRPESSLSNEKTIASFKLLPWVDDHPDGVLLGDKNKGLISAEKKGIHGVIGEEVYFKDGILYANIKIFSDEMRELIDSGKKELSIGYRCKYQFVSGNFEGTDYEVIQYDILGNHIALVEAGRSGKEIAVKDSYTFDSLDIKEFTYMPENGIMQQELTNEINETNSNNEPTFEQMHAFIESHAPMIHAISKMIAEKNQNTYDGGMLNNNTENNMTLDNENKEEENKKEEAEEKTKQGENAMDVNDLLNQINELKKNNFKSFAGEFKERDSLAKNLSNFIGSFDYSAMDSQEVAEYGIQKIGLECPKGAEKIALASYLKAKQSEDVVFALDAKSNSQKATKTMEDFLNNINSK